MTKPSKRTFKAPAHLTQHRAAARWSGGVHRHTTTPRQRGGRHATGPVSAHRRDGMSRAPIHERDWRPSCIVRRSSSSSVVSGERTSIRATTAVSSLLKLRLLVDEILTNSKDHYSTPTKPLNCTLFPTFGWRSGCLRTWLAPQVRTRESMTETPRKANAAAGSLVPAPGACVASPSC